MKCCENRSAAALSLGKRIYLLGEAEAVGVALASVAAASPFFAFLREEALSVSLGPPIFTIFASNVPSSCFQPEPVTF